MLLLLAEYLQQFYKGFGVFQYLTLRGILSVLTALSLSLWLGPWMIRTLQIRQIGQAVRNDGPQSHLSKKGTPTMGGALSLPPSPSARCCGRIFPTATCGWCWSLPCCSVPSAGWTTTAR